MATIDDVLEAVKKSRDQIVRGSGSATWYVTDGKTKRTLGGTNITKQEDAAQLAYSQMAEWDDGAPFVVDLDWINNVKPA